MLRFKLILQDASGKSRSATVEAGSQAEAVDLARRKGYQVRHIEPVHDLDDGDSEPPAPVETAEHGYGYNPPSRAPRRAPQRDSANAGAPRGDKRSPLPMLLSMALSGMAFLLACATLGYVLFRGTGSTASTESRPEGSGSGLAAYDFTTATKAMESEAKIESKMDLRASLELERKTSGLRTQEKADTLKVHREADFQGAKIVFYSYKVKGEMKYATQGFEKHEESGLWIRKSIGVNEVQNENPDLAREMREWTMKGPEKEAKSKKK